MALHNAFRGHGLFIYDASTTLKRYGEKKGPPSELAKALVNMGCTHAWVRLFGVKGAVPENPTFQLIEALKSENISLAGWGYPFGEDWEADLKRTIDLSTKFGLDAFVADIEPGNNTSSGMTKWSPSDFNNYITGASEHFSADNLAMSTWPLPAIHDKYYAVELVEIASPKVGMFAPQAYWMTFPKKIHYDVTSFNEKDYPRNNPASFARLVVDGWRAMGVPNSIVVTGQAYWGEGSPNQKTMERKMAAFVKDFDEWPKIVGLNWWHAGGGDAMSDAMVATLQGAKLDKKAYGNPDDFARPVKRLKAHRIKESSAKETSFDELVGIPVHYDRDKKKAPYGSKGIPSTFDCTYQLKGMLEECLSDLFKVWKKAQPTIILSAGTIGDGKKAHGKGLAFDLDGFYWGDTKFMMDSYKANRNFYIGINAHLFLYFPQVLGHYYPDHHDHFHVDFNFSKKFRPDSNAQMFFVQSALRYLFGQDLGKSGVDNDGVDGLYGSQTVDAIKQALQMLGLRNASLSDKKVWTEFLVGCRDRGFA